MVTTPLKCSKLWGLHGSVALWTGWRWADALLDSRFDHKSIIPVTGPVPAQLCYRRDGLTLSWVASAERNTVTHATHSDFPRAEVELVLWNRVHTQENNSYAKE